VAEWGEQVVGGGVDEEGVGEEGRQLRLGVSRAHQGVVREGVVRREW
jgi:hypothetical protein